ncbi:MAG: hypothetical protein JO027_03010 [Solirubrobacterales bacterium]|nr:hypothetical protein [Solirubrobacterales bacterium]
MSQFFDELESQLRSAAETVAGAGSVPRAGRPRRRRRWLPARIELAPVLASVIVVLVVGAALVLLGRGHGVNQPTPPASPSPNGGLAALIQHTPQKQLRQEFAYMAAATRGVQASPACQVQQPSGVSFVHATPDPQLLSTIGVLRRPAEPSDHLANAVLAGIPDVYSGFIRRAFSVDGRSMYVVVAGFDRATSVPSDLCFALQEQALERYLPKIPPGLRTPTTELQTGYIAWDQQLVAHTPRDGICLIEIGRSESSTSCGITAAQISLGVTPTDDQGVYSGIVPDGVATVTLTFPAAHGHPARSVTGPAIGNVYTIAAGLEPQQPVEPTPTVTWRSAHGALIKTIPVPTPAQERAGCRQALVACTLLQDGGLTESSGSSSSTSATAPQLTQIAPSPPH